MALTSFPSQKRLTNQRTDKFYKECADAAIEMMNYEQSEGLRASFDEKRINYDLASNKLDPADVQRMTNPMRLEGYDFPAEVRNYPLLKPKIDLLTGEEIKRRFDWKVMLRNPDAISEKEEMIKQRYFETMQGLIESNEKDPEKIKAKLQELEKWRKYSAQDLREKMSSEILAIQYDQQGLKYQFNRGFEDALIGGEEIYSTIIIAGDPVVRKENPLNVHTIRSGDSPYVEDSDIIIIEGYLPLGKVIDDYYDELTSKQISDIEGSSMTAANPMMAFQGADRVPDNYMAERFNEDIIIMPSAKQLHALTGAYDEQGNIRVRRVYWKSRRKVGRIKSTDENGYPFYDLVDENYKPDPNLGEEIKWVWVNEWLQTVVLGDDIYLSMKPFPRIGISMTNPSICMAPIVGTIYQINASSAMSLMSYGKSYQYFYNLIMHNTEKAVIRSRGVIPVIPAHLMPDGWTIEDWIYYLDQVGFIVEDAFKESTKAGHQGKLGGAMNRGSEKLDLTNGAYIQQNAAMLQMIKANLDELTGVSAQRQGQVENRELVGNVERSITQSSHITEKWFSLHENTKLRVMTNLLELTRYAWRNRKEKRQFVLSDMSSMILDFDGEQFASAEYGLYLSNASSDMELFAALKQFSTEALRGKLIKMSDVMSIYMDNSMSSIRRKIEQGEEDAMQQASQAAQAENEQIAAELKQKEADAARTDETKRYIAELVAETQLKIANAKMNPELESLKVETDSNLERLKLDNDMQKTEKTLADKREDRIMQKGMHDKEIEVKNKAIAAKPKAVAKK